MTDKRHLMQINPGSQNARGGTELMQERLYDVLPSSLLEKFQIWFSRYRPLEVDPLKYQVFFAHDLAQDPESAFLSNEGWKKFHRLVFVSNWQMQEYIRHHNIPYSRCVVLKNAIEPIMVTDKPLDKIRIGYWSTPHRGLNIAISVFEFLAKDNPNIVFDVFSSFNLYGWGERDAQYNVLFDKCNEHPQINYHGAVDNQTVRDYASKAHILAYPSTWMETSCIVLMEAMSAKMLCVHSNLGALYETAANWTLMYQFDEDQQEHASRFHGVLQGAIDGYASDAVQMRLESQKAYADVFYNWTVRQQEWEIELHTILEMPLELESTPVFSYKTS